MKNCIEERDYEKLEAFLKTINDFNPSSVEQTLLEEAYRKLNCWNIEKMLKQLMNQGELSQTDINQGELSQTDINQGELSQTDINQGELSQTDINDLWKAIDTAELLSHKQHINSSVIL